MKDMILNALLSLAGEEAEEVVGYLVTQNGQEELYLDADHLYNLGLEGGERSVFALTAGGENYLGKRY